MLNNFKSSQNINLRAATGRQTYRLMISDFIYFFKNNFSLRRIIGTLTDDPTTIAITIIHII